MNKNLGFVTNSEQEAYHPSNQVGKAAKLVSLLNGFGRTG